MKAAEARYILPTDSDEIVGIDQIQHLWEETRPSADAYV
jgi:hypothetical protein